MGKITEVLITVPTYWFSGKMKNYKIGEVFYDHPTPIDQNGTLANLLKSLENVEGNFDVLVIATSVEFSLEEKVRKKVEKIIEPFKGKLRIMLFCSEDLRILRSRLKALNLPEGSISLKGYGNVRNIQLIMAQILKADVVISLDDDEVITDKNFLKKALEYIGREYKGTFVGCVGGFYLNLEDSKETFDMKRETKNNIFYLKENIIDKAIEILKMKPDRLVETSLILGGNMVIHKNLFQKVPFDPYIPRGEDMDYLINAKLLGYTFFFDKELSVLHIPPYTRSQLFPDIVRFIYEREKLIMAKKYGFNVISPELLNPYPGLFIQNDIEEHVLDILQKKGMTQDFLNEAKKYSRVKLKHFFKFLKEWPKFMEILSKDDILKEIYREKLTGGKKP